MENITKVHHFVVDKKTSTTGLMKLNAEYPSVRAKVKRYNLVYIELKSGVYGCALVTNKKTADTLKKGDVVLMHTLGRSVFSIPVKFIANGKTIRTYTFAKEYRKDLKY